MAWASERYKPQANATIAPRNISPLCFFPRRTATQLPPQGALWAPQLTQQL